MFVTRKYGNNDQPQISHITWNIMGRRILALGSGWICIYMYNKGRWQLYCAMFSLIFSSGTRSPCTRL